MTQTLAADNRSEPLVAVFLVRPSSIVLADDSELLREPPRPPESRQDGYEQQFDRHSVFYDVFRVGEDVFLSGPPLLNLGHVLAKSAYTVDGHPVGSVELRDWDRTQRSWLRKVPAGQALTVHNPHFSATVDIGEDLAGRFAGRRSLMAISKDNELTWISDWLTFYHRAHGVDAVVLYDNGSEKYGLEELRATVAAVPGIEVGAVVDWPFKFGPGPGPDVIYDSAYCQHSALEHAHWRFLRRAAGVIDADIDELVMTDDGRSVFDHAAESRSGALRYSGRWIEMVTEVPRPRDRVRRFVDYKFYDPESQPTTFKWTMLPGRVPDSVQWRIHSLATLKPDRTARVMHRHFKGINTNWRYNRTEALADPTRHLVDQDAARTLEAVFGSPGGTGHRTGARRVLTGLWRRLAALRR